MGFSVVHMNELEWTDRPPEAGDAIRRVAGLTDRAGFRHSRANLWRYEPGAQGRRHRHAQQEETFVVLAGTLTMYLGDPPERIDVPTGGVVHVEPGMPLQTVNHGTDDLLVYAHGAPPERERAELLDSAV